MPAPKVTIAFLELLMKSKLVTLERIEELNEQYDLADLQTPSEVAQTLIDAGELTQFQADRLLEGRHRGFFIDRFKSIHILGTGGMGWLYLAEDIETGNRVAVKMLPKRLEGDPGMITRFRLEARAGINLNHPNIVKTYSIEQTDGVYGDVHFVVMELVHGINLEELIVLNGPVPWPQACDLIRQAAAGLHHAHENGTIHRDVKPANLLIDTEGHVRIADFGLSKLESEADDEFSLQMIFGHDCLGTADYIAPEQTLDSNAVDGRADIYSLGCTMYAALSGKLPFPLKSTAEKLEAQRSQKPRPLGERVDGLPAEVLAIIEKMMAKRPEHRFQSARDVSRALASFAQRAPAEFDFMKVLEKRTQLARKKISAKKDRHSSGSSATTGRSGTTQSAVETMIRDDDTHSPG